MPARTLRIVNESKRPHGPVRDRDSTPSAKPSTSNSATSPGCGVSTCTPSSTTPGRRASRSCCSTTPTRPTRSAITTSTATACRTRACSSIRSSTTGARGCAARTRSRHDLARGVRARRRPDREPLGRERARRARRGRVVRSGRELRVLDRVTRRSAGQRLRLRVSRLVQPLRRAPARSSTTWACCTSRSRSRRTAT